MRNTIKFCLLLSAMFTPSLAYGDSVVPPRSYVTPSANGKFVFVMIAPIEADHEGLYLRDENKLEAQQIRARYPASGMYLNDGSTTALWKVDWYANSVLVASDGVHLVRRGPWVSNLSDEAFTFFANGKELRRYKVGDLVETKVFLPQTVSHFDWERDMKLEDDQRTLSVATLSKEKYVFDYTTGEMISAYRPIRAIVVAVVVALLLLALLIKRRRMFTKGLSNKALQLTAR